MTDFSGGLNEDDAPGALQANELRVAENVYWRGRALSSRPGGTLLVSDIDGGANCTGIWQLERNQGANLDVLGVYGAKLYKDLKTTPIDITGAVVIGDGHLVTFTHFNDLALMCNGTATPWKWSGTGDAAVLGGAPPAFLTMIAKWNRVFGAGHASAPRTIRFTALGDPESWPAANTVAAILGDATSAIEGRDYILQLGHLGDSVFVGNRNSIGRVLYTGDSTTPFRYNQLSDFGIEGPHAYVAVGSGGYFISCRGIHYIRPSDILITYESSVISGRRLRQTFADLSNIHVKFAAGSSHYTRDGNLVLLWKIMFGSQIYIIVMDVTDGPGNERFALWSGIANHNLFANVRNAATKQEELLEGTSTGEVWHFDDGNYAMAAGAVRSPIVSEAITRWEDFGVPSEKKNFRDLYVETGQRGGFSIGIDVYYDYGRTPGLTLVEPSYTPAGAFWGAPTTWGTTYTWATRIIARNYYLGVDDGVVLSFGFRNTVIDQAWALYKAVPAVEAVGEGQETD